MDTTSVKTLASRKDCTDAVLELIRGAELRVAIFSQQLEPFLYNDAEVCDLFSKLARKNRHTDIRVLAQKTRHVAADGHCLIRLSQRLSSCIQIRIPDTPELQNYRKSLLIIDDHSILIIDNPERYAGTLIENNRLHVKTELEFFDQAWENSVPDQNTRPLQI
jgi:hypothetical protein